MSRSIGIKSDDACVACGSSHCRCVDDSIIYYRNPYLPHYEVPPPPPPKGQEHNQEIIQPIRNTPHQQPRQLRADYVIVALSVIAAAALTLISIFL
jgi:hypothetical protein